MMGKKTETPFPGQGLTWTLRGLAALGAVVFALGAVWRPAQAWPNFLVTFFMMLGFGLGGGLVVAMHDAAGARWATRLRRIPESMALTLPQLSFLVVVLLLGARTLYPWAGPEAAKNPMLVLKQGWLNLPFFSLRTVLYAVVWSLAGWVMVRRSQAGQPGVARAAAFLILFGATIPLAGTDWIMSLEPRWASTIFGVYAFAGIFQSGVALSILLLLGLQRAGVWKGPILKGHLHDLGKLLFAFSCFWMYMWFSQYMLIWYTDLPDEIFYYANRGGAWFNLMLVLVIINFGVPFLALMTQPSKESAGNLAWVSVAVLLGHWLDLYWMILPPFQGGAPRLGLWEIALPLGGTSAFLLLFLKNYRSAPPVPEEEAHRADVITYH